MSIDLAPSRRERKKQATRQALHEAAFTLAEEHGLAGLTVEAIAARADVAPRTFFNYFACKEDAILNRDPDWPETLRLAVVDRPAGEDPLTALRRVLEEEGGRRLLDADRFLRRMRSSAPEPHLQAAMAGISEETEQALVAGVAERTGPGRRRPVPGAGGERGVGRLQGGRTCAGATSAAGSRFDACWRSAFDTLARAASADEGRRP